MSAVVAYTPAAGCEAHLDSWCMQNCPHASLEQLYARLDVQQSGNTKLCVSCSYCAFKEQCYPEAKQFNYARGPVWLVDIKRQPKVDSEEIL